jgi:acetyltransferase-like isoleucine patch superfamily enzyme
MTIASNLKSRWGFLFCSRIWRTKLRKKVRILHPVRIKKSYISGDVEIAEKCKLDNISIVGTVRIGRYTSINGPNTDIYTKIYPVIIGSFCSIARNVTMQEYNHKMNRISTYFMNQNIFNGSFEDDISSKGPITIGSDVWIAANVTILSGSTIGDGVVIAANSVVNSEIPPYAIAGGVPAKVIGYRFDDEIIEELLKLKWWDWDIERIIKYKNTFLSDSFILGDLREMK